MTNDEIEKIMNFMIERQERFDEQVKRIADLQEQTSQHQKVSAVQLEQAEAMIKLLVERHLVHEERLDLDKETLNEYNDRIKRFERSYTVIADLLQKHDTQIESMTDGINNLTATVNRYIAAHNNGSSNGNS